MTTTNRPPLSPAAQHVLDAFENASDGEYVEGVWVVNERTMLAAALRAAADEIDAPPSILDVPEQEQRWYVLGVTNFRRKVLAIATELEGHA